MKRVIIKKSHTGMPSQYYARIPIDGKERMTVLCTVAEAEAQRDPETFLHYKLIEAVLKLTNGVKVSTVSASQRSLGLGDLKNRWIDSLAVSENTRQQYSYAVEQFLRYHPEKQVHEIKATSTRPMIREMLDKGKSSNTIRSYIKAVQIMLKYAEREEIVTKVPALEQPTAEKRNIRIYSEAELDMIEDYLKKMDEFKPEVRNRYRCHMMLRYLGLRAGEVWSLRLENIDMYEEVVTLKQVKELGWKPKKGKEAQLPIVGKLKAFLLEDLKNRDPREKYYLDKGDGHTYTVDVSTLNTIMHRVMVRLGLGDTAKTLHGYRASAITHMLEAGVAPHEVQAVARHEDLKTTLGYLHQRGISQKALATLQ